MTFSLSLVEVSWNSYPNGFADAKGEVISYLGTGTRN